MLQKKVTILVVEDEFIESEDIKRICQNLGFKVIGVAQNEIEALSLFERYHPDIVIIDIKLGKDTQAGIKVAEYVYEKANLPILIFLTQLTSVQTINSATQYLPINYLVKPFTEVQLQATLLSAIEKYKAWIPGTVDCSIHLGKVFVPDSKFGYSLTALNIKDILYLEADGAYCKIYLANKQLHVSVNLKRFSAALPTSIFVRIHRSYVVNLHHINSLNRQSRCVSIGPMDFQIPIGANYYSAFIQLLSRLK